jgi:glycosyltransferase involved in cell wall biosynthesis
MESPAISVIICTHNPRVDYLMRVLEALKIQSLPQEKWELILVDNASNEPLAKIYDLSWHRTGRHVHEAELGLTPARLRGIIETQAEIIVFVDDDNVLSGKYLEEALQIAKKYHFLGAWGGSIRAEFETPPPSWTEEYWSILAIREIDQPVWSNCIDYWPAQPCGAGLCVRRSVAEQYLQELRNDNLRRRLDRRGNSLLSTGDSDLVWTSLKLNLGWGNFPELEMVHLLSPTRLTEAYLLKLVEGMTASSTALAIRRGKHVDVPTPRRQALQYLKTRLLRGARVSRFLRAQMQGVRRGLEIARSTS